MNKHDLLQKIKSLEGISQDERAYLINLVNTTKKYGLVWEDKPEDVEELLRENLPVLREVKEKRILGTPLPATEATKNNPELFEKEPKKDKDTEEYPNHILIEGDNLHALTALTFTHENNIDLIYIDPPYNTGNKDFKYNDTYVDKEDSYRHSKWLSFMSKRLRLAKRLLKQSGVIFVSIDENEQAQLKMLCDEVFKENNLLGSFTWVRKKKGSNLSKEYRKVTENLLCYKNGDSGVQLYGVKAYAEKQVPLLNRANNVSTLRFPPNVIFTGRGILDGKMSKGVYGDGELTVELMDDIQVKDTVVITPFEITGRFRWSQDTVDDEIKNGSEFYISSTFRINVARYNQGEKFKAPSSLISPEDGIGTNEDASEELRNIFAEKHKLPFDYPKPLSLIKYIINSVSVNNRNISVLDFFAGSGTTLHATMQLNTDDGGSRQCILVTDSENNICEEVTYERNKRVIQGYTNVKDEQVQGLTNNTLRYYKSEFVSRDTTIKNKRELTRLATELLCIKEDMYEEQKTIGDFQLNATYVRGFQQGNHYMLIIYDDEVIDQVVKVIQQTVKKSKGAKLHFKIYVFSNGQYPYTEEFEEVLPHVTLCALPDAIYKAYQNVLPKKHRAAVPAIEDETITEE